MPCDRGFTDRTGSTAPDYEPLITAILLLTDLTPSTPDAARAALSRVSCVSAVPDKVTTPFATLTLNNSADSGSASTADFTFAASSESPMGRALRGGLPAAVGLF